MAQRVLFIAYNFPPCSSIGGSIRSQKFARYLPEFGWEPVVLTAKENNGKPFEIFPDVHRISSFTPFRKPFNLGPYGWSFSAWRYCREELLPKNPFDILYISCPPFPQIHAALKLKHHTGLPLVVDFRDAWSLAPYTNKNIIDSTIYKHIFPHWEKTILSDTDAIILNSPSALTAYQAHYPKLKSRMHLITNGYDDEDFKSVTISPNQDNELKMLYCGGFGISGRKADLIFSALGTLKKAKIPVSLTILGDNSQNLIDKIVQFHLEGQISLHPQIAHKNVLSKMGEFDVMLLYQEWCASPVTPVAGKTYEYLRIGKPILAVAPEGDNLTLIKTYASKFEAVTSGTAEPIVKAARNLFLEKQAGRLRPHYPPKGDFLELYNRRKLTFRLAQLFSQLVN